MKIYLKHELVESGYYYLEIQSTNPENFGDHYKFALYKIYRY